MKSDGSIEWYKARVVILENIQVEGLDYDETFAPVAKMVTVRTLLYMAATRNAVLRGNLREKVYMKLSSGFLKEKIGKFQTPKVLVRTKTSSSVLVCEDDWCI